METAPSLAAANQPEVSEDSDSSSSVISTQEVSEASQHEANLIDKERALHTNGGSVSDETREIQAALATAARHQQLSEEDIFAQSLEGLTEEDVFGTPPESPKAAPRPATPEPKRRSRPSGMSVDGSSTFFCWSHSPSPHCSLSTVAPPPPRKKRRVEDGERARGTSVPAYTKSFSDTLLALKSTPDRQAIEEQTQANLSRNWDAIARRAPREAALTRRYVTAITKKVG